MSEARGDARTRGNLTVVEPPAGGSGLPAGYGAPPTAIIPRTFKEVVLLAEHLSRSEMVPASYKGKPHNVVVAILKGLEVGLPPMTAIQSIAVIGNRPGLFGDALPAIALSRGYALDIEEEYEGARYDDDFAAVCRVWVQRRGRERCVEARFSVGDAKLAQLWGRKSRSGEPSPWVLYPDRMLRARARAFAIRDACPQANFGFTAEEQQDVGEAERGPERAIRDVTPGRPNARRGAQEPRTDGGDFGVAPEAGAAAIAPQGAPEAPQGASDDDDDPVVFTVVDDIGEIHAHVGEKAALLAVEQLEWLVRNRPAQLPLLRENNEGLVGAMRGAGYGELAERVEAALAAEPEPVMFVVQPGIDRGRTKHPERALDRLRTLCDACATSEELEKLLQDDGAVTLSRQFEDAGMKDMADAAQLVVYTARERVRRDAIAAEGGDADPDDDLPF